ncbi:MAG: hypothetical protein ACXABY_17555, partial [Candidatus Thorarchaeota archaeon]
NETELEFRVRFYEIVEYVDEDDDGLYNETVDTTVQVVQLSDFLPIDYRVEIRADGVVHILEVTTSDGVFSARIYATGEFADIDGTTIAPNQVKIDVMISNFNYIDDLSQLALKVKLEASAETEYDEDTEDEEEGRAIQEAEVDFLMNGYSGFFSWKETVDVDGIIYPVNASLIDFDKDESSQTDVDEDRRQIYLNYPRGNIIVHDPKVGVANILLTPGFGSWLAAIVSSSYFPIIALAAIAVVAGVAIKVRRS